MNKKLAQTCASTADESRRITAPEPGLSNILTQNVYKSRRATRGIFLKDVLERNARDKKKNNNNEDHDGEKENILMLLILPWDWTEKFNI